VLKYIDQALPPADEDGRFDCVVVVEKFETAFVYVLQLHSHHTEGL
jgi:hypothetical protein